jgi:hypothetical protein
MSAFSSVKIFNPSYLDLNPNDIHPTATREGPPVYGMPPDYRYRIRLTYEEERRERHEKSKPIISLVSRMLNNTRSEKKTTIANFEKDYKKKGGRRKLDPFNYDDNWRLDDDYAENVQELNDIFKKIEELKEEMFDFWPKTKYDLAKLFKDQEKTYNDANPHAFFQWTEPIDFEVWQNRFMMVNVRPSDYDEMMKYESNNELTISYLNSITEWIKTEKKANTKQLSKRQWTFLIAQWIVEKRKRNQMQETFIFYPPVKNSKFDVEKLNFYEILMEDIIFQLELITTFKKDMKKEDSIALLQQVKDWLLSSKGVSPEELLTFDYYRWAGSIRDFTTENKIMVKKSMVFRPPVCKEDAIPFLLNHYRIQKDNFNDTEEEDYDFMTYLKKV